MISFAVASAPERFWHIPRVLYLWRSIVGSTASAEAINANPDAWQAGSRAIKAHFWKDTGSQRTSVGPLQNSIKSITKSVLDCLKVSIVTPTDNRQSEAP